MKASEIKALADQELLEKLKQARTELFNLRFRLATGNLDNPNAIRAVKKDIARLHTELRAREIEASRSQAS
ncbi:50S ribosomal protein L29 [Coriobacteriia bacterium Es71-Z0120]|uniref:50S ribosomal protein L29 n=1 Tax=Parvivirga hydrogeniphila TaxID=2939460 RepID=UPI0009C86223|nr:50S ribosomal protein L29 [Parvivirga hydrogeniphila]MCL4078543.1 50S ribosomal protein L29 [Parvivirga hydrogeniphila]GAV32366.1 50S ribosomal protein L29 [Coriobacteriaceae bacterium EMTCatB1]